MIKEIAFIAYPCRDVASTRRWYEEMLGLTFAGAYVEDGVEKYNESHVGSGCFSLMSDEWLGGSAGKAVGLALEVDNLSSAVALLHERGVALTDFFDGPVCRQATLHDREGNRITLHERKRDQ